MKYEIVKDLTSDVAFRVFGKDLKSLCEHAAEAISTVICEVDQIKPEKKVIVKVTGEDEKDLLFNWLQEIIATVEIEDMFFNKFNITNISSTELTAELYGEDIDPAKGNTVVKAITYHKFNLEQKENGYEGFLTLDI